MGRRGGRWQRARSADAGPWRRASSLQPRASGLQPRASSVQPRASGLQAPVSSRLAGSVEVEKLKARGDGSRRRFSPSSPATSRASGGVVMAGPAPGTWAHPSRRGPGSRRAAEEGSRGGQQRRAAEEGSRGGQQSRASGGGSREGPVEVAQSRSKSRRRGGRAVDDDLRHLLGHDAGGGSW